MRRVAVQAVRAARRPTSRKFSRYRWTSSYNNHAIVTRAATAKPFRGLPPPLHSSIQLKSLSVALASTAVAGGAYYALTGQQPIKADELSRGPDGKPISGPPQYQQKLTASNVYSSSNNAGPSVATAEEAATSTRRALVVEQGQLYSGTIVGDGPLSKETDDYGRKVLEMMTPEQATSKLRRNEESFLVGRGRGVIRYDVTQLPSNDPIEDDHAEKILEIPQSVAATDDGTATSDWMFWGVFDGHSGWITSAKLRSALISFVARELNETYKTALTDPQLKLPTNDAIDSALKKGFVRLDNEITNESVEKVLRAKSKTLAAEMLAPALAGSCALLSFYDSRSKLLRVACTGDSRAVLGRRGASGKWTATALSMDQTGGTESEIARLRKEHPGEEYVTANGRILGSLEPSRAFGDAIYKWSKETQSKLKNLYFGRTPSPRCLTPPYVTAEPIVTTTEIDPSKGDFVVMATDGLWEMLTNEEVVGLVGRWLETNGDSVAGHAPATHQSRSWLSSWLGGSKSAPLPIESKPQEPDPSGSRSPIRRQQWGSEGKEESSRFVVEDKNVATHLVRNALGGRDRDQVCALLTLPSPYSRRYRDDLTVEVIFFGEGDRTGRVDINTEASTPVGQIKPKL